VGEVNGDTDWGRALAGADVIVHLAARVHMIRDAAADPLAEFRRVNTAGTVNLARQAADSGAKRLIFMSSVKVNGEGSFAAFGGRTDAYRESDPPLPGDAYGVSKFEAESGVLGIASETGIEVVIIRPPLVYGPGVGANFERLIRAVSRGVPLPLGAIHNRRSLVALDNLVDFVLTSIEHPAAKNETFLVSDGEDLSTTDLLRRLGRALGRPARLIPVPPLLILAGATVCGKRDAALRLLGTLRVDISKAYALLGWKPTISVDEGLRRATALLR
jgi:nucleoside-diphosphate-sugar epimerase